VVVVRCGRHRRFFLQPFRNSARISRARLSGEERDTARELEQAEQWLATQPNIVDAIVAALEHEYDAEDDSAATMVARKRARVSKVLEAWRSAGSPAQS
jgi:hypothetical protein